MVQICIYTYELFGSESEELKMKHLCPDEGDIRFVYNVIGGNT